VDAVALGVDYLTLAGHKLYAPKGVGALYLRSGAALSPLFSGGGQERGLRPGTENVPYWVALGEACALAGEGLAAEAARQAGLVAEFAAGLRAGSAEFLFCSESGPRLPNTAMLCFQGLAAGDILSGLTGLDLGASAGAACHSGGHTVSHVLAAMRVPEDYVRGAVRFSFGRPSTAEEAREAAARTLAALAPLRG
jgi:cysteine desulfurase